MCYRIPVLRLSGGRVHRLEFTHFRPRQGVSRRRPTLCAGARRTTQRCKGDAIEVRFLKSDPSVNKLRSMLGIRLRRSSFSSSCRYSFWPSLGRCFGRRFARCCELRRLFKYGKLAPPKVVFVKKRPPHSGRACPALGSQVYLELQSASQGKREVVAMCRNDWLVNQLTSGATVHVAYSDDKPVNVALWGLPRSQLAPWLRARLAENDLSVCRRCLATPLGYLHRSINVDPAVRAHMINVGYRTAGRPHERGQSPPQRGHRVRQVMANRQCQQRDHSTDSQAR